MNTSSYFIKGNINDIKNPDGFNKARNYFYKKYIKTTFEEKNDENSDNRRILFYSVPNKANTDDSYVRECNGLILEMNSWKILCLPPRPLTRIFKKGIVNMYLNNKNPLYDLYEANDGTTLNFYYYNLTSSNKKWCMSTTRGYDVAKLKWKNKTYEDVFHEVLEKNNIKPDSFYNSLDKDKCYSFGFKHPEFHPYWEGRNKPVYKIWFIQSVNLSEKENSITVNLENSPLDEIPRQRKLSTHIMLDKKEFKQIGKLLKYANSRLGPMFGYILRSKYPEKTGCHSDILIESKILRNIRKMVYTRNNKNESENNNYDRENYFILKAFLSRRDYLTFFRLFPQYKEQHDLCKETIDKLVDCMIDEKNNNLTSSNKTCEYRKVAKYFLKHLNNFITIDNEITGTSVKEIKKVMMNFILNPKNIDQIYPLVFESEEKEQEEKKE